jgi:peptide deformylase
MALLNILTYPDPFLGIPADPVENVDDSIRKLIDDMAETMLDAPGIGLAAPQVRCGKQVIIYAEPKEKRKTPFDVLINPVIVASSGQTVSEKEGCLSVPELNANVKRAESIVVTGLDREGKPVRIKTDGLLSIILQHEIDHLRGVLFLDRISALKRGFYKKRVQKRIKNEKKA